MYPVSEAFKSEVRKSHTARVRAEIWQGSLKLTSLEPISGAVEIDARRSARRTCSLTVADVGTTTVVEEIPGALTYADLTLLYVDYPTMGSAVASYAILAPSGTYTVTTVETGIVPVDAYSFLTPYGNEVRIWRGVTYDDGSYEEVPLGVFVITNVEVSEGPDGTTVAISGVDRSIRVSRARWTDPYAIQSVATETAIERLLQDRWIEVETAFVATNTTILRATFGTDTNNNPWADALRLADAAGHDLYFDGNGIAVLEPLPDYETASPDAIYLQDEEAVVIDLTRSLDATDTYNGVIATGEGTEQTDVYRGEAWDEDPDSPTYRYGPFGQVPRFYSSSLLNSNEQAQAVADALLLDGKGLTEQIDWTQITDPSLDVGDVVVVVNERAKVNRTLILDRLTIPLLASEPMSAVARAIRFGVEA